MKKKVKNGIRNYLKSVPNIPKITWNAFKIWLKAAKMYWIDAFMTIISVVIVVLILSTDSVTDSLPAVGILFVYSISATLRLYSLTIRKKECEEDE